MRHNQFLKVIITVVLLIPLSVFGQDDIAGRVEAMAKVGACYGPTFSPDGTEIQFLSTMSGSPQIWKMPAEGGWPIQLTNFEDPVSNASWSPRGDKIAFDLAPGGGMNRQVYVMDTDGTGLRQITPGGKTNNSTGVWSKDGTILSYASNQRDPEAIDNYFYYVDTEKTELVRKNEGRGFIVDISGNNKEALLDKMVSRGSNDIYLIDTEGGETLLTAHEGPGTFFAQFSPQGTIYMASNLNRDLIAFSKYEDGDIVILHERDDSVLESFRINHAGNLAILTWNTNGKIEVSLFDLEKERDLGKLEMPVEQVFLGEFTQDDTAFAFTGMGSVHLADIWIYHFDNKKFQKLTESPHPGINLGDLVAPKLVEFNSFDGLKLSGWLYEPTTGVKPYPTVISFHGGPEGQSRPDFSYTFQALLSQGIAVFSPNVRGSSGFGKKFVNLDNGALRANGIKDIKACYDYIVNAGIAKPDKTGIMGGSYGGYMVMAGITEYPDMFAAAANLFGVVNFLTFFENTEPWMAAISKVEYGDPETETEMLKALSPIFKVNEAVTPTLVLHGANDTNVPVIEAEQVVENLKQRNIPVKYILFPDEGHGWRKTKNKVTSTVEIVDWFKNYLGEESSTPEGK